jgi:hypothetical protein
VNTEHTVPVVTSALRTILMVLSTEGEHTQGRTTSR